MNIRLPSITGKTPEEQLLQIRSYLYQLVPQLQIALNGTAGQAAQPDTTKKQENEPIYAMPSGTAAQSTFNALKPYIIQSTDIFTAHYDKTVQKLPEAVKKIGSAGGWDYTVKKSGRCELHGVFALTLTEDMEQYGALWRSEIFSILFPFALSEPVAVCTGEGVIASIEEYDDEGLRIRVLLAQSEEVGKECKLHIQLYAKIKEDEA